MECCGGDPFAIFDERQAQDDRDRYRRRGPDRTTRMLLEMLRPHAGVGTTLLDIGGGVGVIDQELLRAGAGHAVLVEGSGAYLAVARQEARAANVLDRLDMVEGDFVHTAASIDAADIVTLDRVVCCYAGADALVSLSASRARRVYGLVLPRDSSLVRLAIRLSNMAFRLRRRAYRAYAHPNERVDALAAAAGLRPRAERRTFFWRVVVYERQRAVTPP